jgi:hypothetical protein
MHAVNALGPLSLHLVAVVITISKKYGKCVLVQEVEEASSGYGI